MSSYLAYILTGAGSFVGVYLLASELEWRRHYRALRALVPSEPRLESHCWGYVTTPLGVELPTRVWPLSDLVLCVTEIEGLAECEERAWPT